MGQRRKARELAVQTLYALDFADIGGEFSEYESLNKYPEILDQLAEREVLENADSVLGFAEDLVKNTIINLQGIDAEIEKHSEHWRIGKIDHLDLSILHIAVYELVFTDTPPPVVINEALEIARKYSSESSGKFLNGILDAVNKELREREQLEGTRI